MTKNTAIFVYSNEEFQVERGIFEFSDMKELGEELAKLFGVEFISEDGFLVSEDTKITKWEETVTAYNSAIINSIDKYVSHSRQSMQTFFLFNKSAKDLNLEVGGFEDFEQIYQEHLV